MAQNKKKTITVFLAVTVMVCLLYAGLRSTINLIMEQTASAAQNASESQEMPEEADTGSCPELPA